MSDPRVTPEHQTCEEPARIIAPVVDLCRRPGGPRDRQLLCGEEVTIVHYRDDYRLIRARKDGYCGYVAAAALGAPQTPTHKVTAPATHAYAEPDMKSPDRISLSFSSLISAQRETAAFIETAFGHIPRQHLHRLPVTGTDPAAIAALFIGTPYLWGGNSRWGIDCSGLVQAACLACGIPCPGDSDQQQETLGTTVSDLASLRRNDLIFWKGHVAIVTASDQIIHSNAGYMSTVYEPLSDALTRIQTHGDGRPTAFRRIIPDQQTG